MLLWAHVSSCRRRPRTIGPNVGDTGDTPTHHAVGAATSDETELCAHVHFSHIHNEQSYVSITNTHNYYYDILFPTHAPQPYHYYYYFIFTFVSSPLCDVAQSLKGTLKKKIYVFITPNWCGTKRYRLSCVRTRDSHTLILYYLNDKGTILILAKYSFFCFVFFSKILFIFSGDGSCCTIVNRPDAPKQLLKWRSIFDLFCLVSFEKTVSAGELISKATTQIEYHPWSCTRCHGCNDESTNRIKEKRNGHR